MACTDCGFVWQIDRAATVDQVSRLNAACRAALNEMSDAEVRRRPDPGGWSALEYTAHLRDVVGFYRDRIERVRTLERPTMTAIGFARLAVERRYNDEDIDEVLRALDIACVESAALLASLADAEWRRVGIGSEGGERTILVLARRLAHECHHHLGDLARVAVAVGATPRHGVE